MSYFLRKIENGWLVSGLVNGGPLPMAGSGERYFATLEEAFVAIETHAEPVLP